MLILLWIIGAYLLVGVISVVVIAFKDPLILYAWMYFPIVILLFPYFLWVAFTKDDTGRWI